jgi:hypothetical protein
MRARRRSTSPIPASVPPPQSRLTRGAPGHVATAPRSTRIGEALRDSRQALGDIERQLDMLLGALRSPGGLPDAGAPDRLRAATARAHQAIDKLM